MFNKTRLRAASLIIIVLVILGVGGYILLNLGKAAKNLAESTQSAVLKSSQAKPVKKEATSSAAVAPTLTGPLPGNLIVADAGNNRIIILNPDKKIIWEYPTLTTPASERLYYPDDAFLSPDGKSIITNQEPNQVISIIDIATKKLTWSYGHPRVFGSGVGYLHTPDDAYILPDGTVSVADIKNCRILFISTLKTIVKQYGVTGVCRHNPPKTFASPNGDTPLPDGGMLVTEIGGSFVDRLDKDGNLIYSVKTPLNYPSDAQLTSDGNILVIDYHNPGRVIKISPEGKVLWDYGPKSGIGKLKNPSLAIELPNGNIALNDDDNHRVIIIDPKTNAIVWSYGTNGVAGINNGLLHDPDGIDFIPTGKVTIP